MDDPAKEQQSNKNSVRKRSLRRYDPDQVMGIRDKARLSAAAHSRDLCRIIVHLASLKVKQFGDIIKALVLFYLTEEVQYEATGFI